MTAPDYFVFVGDSANGIPPRFPSVEDLGGASYRNHATLPPHPGDPNALDFNQQQQVLAAIAKLSPVMAVEVTFTSATVCAVTGFWSANPNLSATDVTPTYVSALTRLTLTIQSGNLPTSSRRPELAVHTGTTGFLATSSSRSVTSDTITCYAPGTVAAGTVLTIKVFGVP